MVLMVGASYHTVSATVRYRLIRGTVRDRKFFVPNYLYMYLLEH